MKTKALYGFSPDLPPFIGKTPVEQVALLRELRQLEPDTPAYNQILAAVLFTVNGIAAGMKTTG